MAATMMKREQLTNAERDKRTVSLAFYSGMVMGALGLAIAVLLALILTGTHIARAHDSWISRGGHRNPAGEWCCGAGDCALMDPKSVTQTSHGYSVSGWGTIDGSGRREFYHEGVPEQEAQPSPDGAFWRCKRPDGTRRCFFAPPPNT